MRLTDGSQTATITVSINDALSDDAFDAVANQTVNVTTLDDEATAPAPGTAVVVPIRTIPAARCWWSRARRKSDRYPVNADGSGDLVVTLKGERQGTFSCR